jgi:chaperonin GroEL (HSP60 family)
MDDALGAFAQAAAVLEGVVGTSIGPHGAHKVITSATGKVLVTKSGAAILDALSADTPAMLVLLEAARRHGRAHGDGTISFVLMVAEALRQLDACVRACALGAPTRARLARALAHAASCWLPTVAFPALRREAAAAADGDQTTLRPPRELACALVATALAGELGASASAQLGSLLAECWARSGGASGRAPAELPLASVAGAALERSLLVEGLVFDGALVSPHMRADLRAVRCAVLACALGAPAARDDGRREAVAVASGGAYAELLARAETHADGLVRTLAALGVRLLVCTQRLSPAAAASCERHGISALACADDAMAARLCDAMRAVPLRETSLADGVLTDALRDACGAPAAVVSTRGADAPGRRLLVVKVETGDGDVGAAGSARAHTLLLRAPTEGMALELARAARRGWRVLSTAWARAPAAAGAAPLAVAGGCAFEFALAKRCADAAAMAERGGSADGEGGAARHARARALRLLAEMALAPARALHCALERGAAAERWPAVRARMLARPGSLAIPSGAEAAPAVLESFESRAALLSAALELVAQLARVDSIALARAVRGGGGGGARGARGTRREPGASRSDSGSESDGEGAGGGGVRWFA